MKRQGIERPTFGYVRNVSRIHFRRSNELPHITFETMPSTMKGAGPPASAVVGAGFARAAGAAVVAVTGAARPRTTPGPPRRLLLRLSGSAGTPRSVASFACTSWIGCSRDCSRARRRDATISFGLSTSTASAETCIDRCRGDGEKSDSFASRRAPTVTVATTRCHVRRIIAR